MRRSQDGVRARGAGSDPRSPSALLRMLLPALFLLLAALVRLLWVHLLLLLLLLLLRVTALRFLAGMTVLLVFHDRDPVDKGHAAAECRRRATVVPERLIAGEKAVIAKSLFSCVQPARRAVAANLGLAPEVSA